MQTLPYQAKGVLPFSRHGSIWCPPEHVLRIIPRMRLIACHLHTWIHMCSCASCLHGHAPEVGLCRTKLRTCMLTQGQASIMRSSPACTELTIDCSRTLLKVAASVRLLLSSKLPHGVLPSSSADCCGRQAS